MYVDYVVKLWWKVCWATTVTVKQRGEIESTFFKSTSFSVKGCCLLYYLLHCILMRLNDVSNPHK